MQLALIRVGNSRGIRIPKSLIEQCGFGDTVQLHVEDNRLVIAPDHAPRRGWAEAFQAAGQTSGDELLLDTLPESQFDREEWEW